MRLIRAYCTIIRYDSRNKYLERSCQLVLVSSSRESAFASAKAAQKSLAQSVARQLWAENVHVSYAIIDASVGPAVPKQMHPDSIAREYWHLATQTKDCWTFMHHIQTSVSDMALL